MASSSSIPLEQGTQSLRPKARLIRAIGDQLISNEIVALLELVKNAYDADATAVLLRFIPPLEPGKGRVQVIDTGHGMTLDTLRGAWMEPATDWKRDRPHSEKFGRRVLGEKGLGRFAAARIANHFYVTSRRAGEPHETRVLLDWTEFDVKDRYLDEVLVLWEVTEPKDIIPYGPFEALLERCNLIDQGDFEQGTVLSLELVRMVWTEDNFRNLQRALARIVSPFDAEIGSNFKIYLEPPPEFGEFDGLVTAPQVFEHPHYILEGNVAADGSCDLVVGRPGAEEHIAKRFVLRDERSPKCGPFSLKLRVWNRDPESLKPLASILGSTVPDVRRDIDAIGGVNVYRDGFRILPYGEYGNDWIGLDRRRIQNPTLRISNNQVSGYIFISAESNPLLVDQSNREGLFENQAVQDLRDLIIHAVAEVENTRYLDKPRQERTETQAGSLFSGFDLSATREVAGARHPNDRELSRAIDTDQKRLDENVEKVKKVLSRYQRLATLGSLVDMVLHEGRQPVTRIRYGITNMRTRLERATPESLPLIVPTLLKSLEKLDGNAELLAAIFKKLDPFSGRQRGRPRDVVLEEAIRAGVALVESENETVGADITLPSSQTTVRVDPADIQMVIRNLVDNSLYWLRQVPKDSRKVLIQVDRQTDGSVEVVVSDSGPGIPEKYKDLIWKPYWSAPEKPEGVGIGLAIAGEIVEDIYGGTLEASNEGPLSGATFTIILRRRVG